MSYIKTINNPSEIEVDKTYYKSPIGVFTMRPFPKIEILSHVSTTVTAKLGVDPTIQTMTEDAAVSYINAQGGYSDTE